MMSIEYQQLLEKKYDELCEKLAAHKLPRWNMLPDIELYMDQVIAVMERFLSLYQDNYPEDNRLITPSIINNYVKLKIIPAPVKKRYSREHLAYLIMICILKQTLAISSIVKIISKQLENKTIDILYNDFCNIYEQVVPFVDFGEHEIEEFTGKKPLDDEEDMSSFILKSAILSTTSKFVCEGILSVIADNDEQKTEKDKK